LNSQEYSVFLFAQQIQHAICESGRHQHLIKDLVNGRGCIKIDFGIADQNSTER
jgi:hypothetical protein